MAKRPRVLIVEDQPERAYALAEDLKRAGFACVWEAVDSEAAYRAHLDSPPDLVLAAEGSSGFGAAQAMSILREHGLDVPCVVIADHAGDGAPARHEGAADCVARDQLHWLGHVVRHAVERRRLLRALRQAEQTRRSVEALVRAFVEHAPIGCYIVQAGRFVYINSRLAEIFGCTEAELLGLSSWLGIVDAADRSRLTAQLRALESPATASLRLAFRGRRKDGAPIEVESNNTGAEFYGKPAVVGMLIDVTERKRGEETLRQSEERYRAMFESNPHPMWVLDVETLMFLAVNEAAVQRYGYSREEFLRMTVKDIRSPEEVPRLLAHLERPAQRLERSGVWLHRTKSGEPLEVEIVSHELMFGERRARLVVAYDVTEQLKVKEAQARLIAILEATPDLVAITQLGGEVTFLNPAGRKLLGLGSREELQGARTPVGGALELIPPDVIAQTLRDGWWRGDTELISREQGIIPVSAVVIAHHGASADAEFLSMTARDLRQQKLMEEQLRQAQKMEAVGRLAGGVAHDFNNLLTVISGYSEMALAGLEADHPLRALIEEIAKAGARAAALTRQLLAFSRKQVLVPVVLDLNTLLLDLEKMVRRLIGEDIDLAVRPGPRLWSVKVDAGLLEQVVMNLVVNSRDAMPQGGKLILETANVEFDAAYVQRHAGAKVGQFVMLAVSDSGTGMDRATLARIFEPFFTTKDPERGTGLGLATVHGIVNQCGGHIEVFSEPGLGTTFKVYLPRDRSGAPHARSDHGIRPNVRGAETVLLAEDDDGVRTLARAVLTKNGYQLLEAKNGDEALQLCQQHAGVIHLLVTDVVMPNMSGRQLAERLLALRPKTRVLYLSGYTDDAVFRHGILQNQAAFLQKPFTPGALVSKVRETLDAPLTNGG